MFFFFFSLPSTKISFSKTNKQTRPCKFCPHLFLRFLFLTTSPFFSPQPPPPWAFDLSSSHLSSDIWALVIPRHCTGTESACVSKTSPCPQAPPRPARETAIACDTFSPEVYSQVSWHLEKKSADSDGEIRDDFMGKGWYFNRILNMRSEF